MDALSEGRETLRKLCVGQRLAVLATGSEGGPHASLVAFAATPDLRRFVFATARNTRKWANLIREPRVALLIDDSHGADIVLEQGSAATVQGAAAELVGAERQTLLARYLVRHPELAAFAASPDCALLGVAVARISLVTRFQQVLDYTPELL